ncbi:carbohydrate ABC transporter permease [uncultured Sphaerochaeta sp.]|uniref:carbohydrate ABC transporter permease n=1 Tax=uncultured Sphaerochaeta sp. TaxID=886478 RepID=UPI002A0A4CDF|nr:carbohydrate ABC transporter permease [uncultured Sphaerochaeta sp.]
MIKHRKPMPIGKILVMVASFFWLVPLILIFINSFKPYNDMLQHFLALPKQWSLSMYFETWNKFGFTHLMGNTVLYTVSTVLLVLLVAPMSAYKLSRTKSRFSKFCLLAIIIPMMVPFQSYMISLTRIVSSVGLSGTRIGYILVSTGLCVPLAVFMIHGFVKTVPYELEESACIDGAGKIRTYVQIVLPLLQPILVTVIVLDALATWNDIITNQLIVGGKVAAMNIQNSLYMRFSAQTADWEHALPGIVMSMIPSLIFFALMQRKIISGVTAGSVKG